MSAGEKNFVYYLTTVALFCVVTGEEDNEEESDLALRRCCLKKDAGTALLVREVGLGLLLCFGSGRRDIHVYLLSLLLLCFYSGRRGIHVYLLSLLGACFHVFEIGRVSSIENIRCLYHDDWLLTMLCIFSA